mmetsp:Transcript_13024/g.30739  ORF Transcript_13024/g.30739 Transcript_13024/m.30739 type:complete len:363 (+) Transcript_13024:323-1411(+)
MKRSSSSSLLRRHARRGASTTGITRQGPSSTGLAMVFLVAIPLFVGLPAWLLFGLLAATSEKDGQSHAPKDTRPHATPISPPFYRCFDPAEAYGGAWFARRETVLRRRLPALLSARNSSVNERRQAALAAAATAPVRARAQGLAEGRAQGSAGAKAGPGLHEVDLSAWTAGGLNGKLGATLGAESGRALPHKSVDLLGLSVERLDWLDRRLGLTDLLSAPSSAAGRYVDGENGRKQFLGRALQEDIATALKKRTRGSRAPLQNYANPGQHFKASNKQSTGRVPGIPKGQGVEDCAFAMVPFYTSPQGKPAGPDAALRAVYLNATVWSLRTPTDRLAKACTPMILISSHDSRFGRPNPNRLCL